MIDTLISRFGVLLPILSACITLAAQVTVTHIANEGFLLEGGGRKVLIDALFDGIGGYPQAPPSLQRRLRAGQPPFGGIDLILATHFHDDHFSPRPVLDHLKANPKAVFLSTPQAVAKLRRLGASDVAESRLVSLLPEEGRGVSRTTGGIQVEVINLHHGRESGAAENLGFVVHLGGLRILHIGDTEASAQELRSYGLGDDPVDLALLSAWFVSSPEWIPAVRDVLRPRQIGVMHLAVRDAPSAYFGRPGSFQGQVDQILSLFPQAEIFTRPLQQRVFGRH